MFQFVLKNEQEIQAKQEENKNSLSFVNPINPKNIMIVEGGNDEPKNHRASYIKKFNIGKL